MLFDLIPDYAIYFLIGIAILCFLFRKPKPAKPPRLKPESWLPPELQTAKLYTVERGIKFRGKFNINGTADRVYQLATGELVPVERKNRGKKKTHFTDVMQLSLYAYMLRHNGQATALFGFVVFNGEDFAHKVYLLTDELVEPHLYRYRQLKAGLQDCKKRRDFRCNGCAHAPKCVTYSHR